MKPHFPLFIDISDDRIVVVGGGTIAERRVCTLLSFAGNVTVIAPELTARLQELWEQKEICWIRAYYENSMDEMLRSADMVLAATDDASCNEQIADVCKKAGVLVNVSHKKELCDFYFPAVVVRDNVSVGITASGLHHAQARHMRECVQEIVDKEMKKFS